MNCANHADASAVAYCRTCGKALCANCTRPVKGVIYCEDCLGSRMESNVPPGAAAFAPGARPAGTASYVAAPAAPSGSGPNPALAGILAGFFPFGVGAVYTGQYAKGLAHLIIFVLLVAGASAADSGGSEALGVICGLGIAFFYVYQIIDSVRTARALQMGQPAPDPYGLASTFGSSGAKIETTKIPLGAIILILLGVLFLLHTMGLGFGLDRYWPVLLIVAGGWMFARNWGLIGGCAGRCQCARCRSCRLMGPAVVLTLGFLFLFESLGRISFGRTWPILLLVIGGVKLFQNSASREGHIPLPPPAPGAHPADISAPPAPPTPPSEVSHG